MTNHQKVVYLPNGWIVKYEDHKQTSIALIAPKYEHLVIPISETGQIAETISALAEDAIRSKIVESMFEFNKKYR